MLKWSENRMMLDSVGEVVKRSVATLYSLRDLDAKYLYKGSSWIIIQSANDAYGYSDVVIKFVPSAADISMMEIVMDLLVRVRQQSEDEFRRLWRWASGMVVWKLADIEGCSTKTLRYRLDSTLALLAGWIGMDDVEPVETDELEEPMERSVTAIRLGVHTVGEGGLREQHAKAWIHGRGLMRGGQLVRDGSEKKWKRRRHAGRRR